VLLDIFPYHSPGTFASHVQGVLALQSRELYRPLLWEPYLPTQESAQLFGISLVHGHQAKQGTSGVTRVQLSARAQRDGNNKRRKLGLPN
jgi:hypothetical protein